ncbi:MAG: hypothetical protein ACE15C_00125 [Phycisphaerae bacterium]
MSQVPTLPPVSQPQPPQVRPPGQQPDNPFARLVPYKNAPALLAYYFGVFSAIPVLGIPLAIAAIVLGIIGLVKASRRPEIRGKAHAWAGIITGATLQAAIIFLIVALMGK